MPTLKMRGGVAPPASRAPPRYRVASNIAAIRLNQISHGGWLCCLAEQEFYFDNVARRSRQVDFAGT